MLIKVTDSSCESFNALTFCPILFGEQCRENRLNCISISCQVCRICGNKIKSCETCLSNDLVYNEKDKMCSEKGTNIDSPSTNKKCHPNCLECSSSFEFDNMHCI